MIDELTLQVGTDNIDDVDFGDLFYLNYYGINVFFYVCKTNLYQACIYEIHKKRIKYDNQLVEIIDDDLKPERRKPLIVTENNCSSKSQFWVDTATSEDKNKELIIPINRDTPIYKQAIKIGIEFPETGLYRAAWLKEEQKKGFGYFYWSVAETENIFKKMS